MGCLQEVEKNKQKYYVNKLMRNSSKSGRSGHFKNVFVRHHVYLAVPPGVTGSRAVKVTLVAMSSKSNTSKLKLQARLVFADRHTARQTDEPKTNYPLPIRSGSRERFVGLGGLEEEMIVKNSSTFFQISTFHILSCQDRGQKHWLVSVACKNINAI